MLNSSRDKKEGTYHLSGEGGGRHAMGPRLSTNITTYSCGREGESESEYRDIHIIVCFQPFHPVTPLGGTHRYVQYLALRMG